MDQIALDVAQYGIRVNCIVPGTVDTPWVQRITEGYDDPGWYEFPEGTVAGVASVDAIRRDGIDLSRFDAARAVATPPAQHRPDVRTTEHGHPGTTTDRPSTSPATAAKYSCPHHPDVTSVGPGKCPKCGMQLLTKS